MAVRDRRPSLQASIDPLTEIGIVRLTVSDLERSRRFYEELLGMREVAAGMTLATGSVLALGTASGEVLIELTADPLASARNPRETGLFHLAVLYQTRLDLARALARLALARWPLAGASDHLVSEALYLNDPDGNGIELYADRPRSAWPYTDEGQVEMDTLPLDLEELLEELEFPAVHHPEPEPLMPAGTRIGHVHLQVSSLPDAEEFYVQLLGFDLTSRWRGQALFVSAGGYHHHIGLNTWNSLGASAPAPGSVGLRSFELLLPSVRSLHELATRVSAAGLPLAELAVGGSGLLVRDPSGNGITLRAA